MNLQSFKIPNIITTDNFVNEIIKITKGKNCILFTSNFWKAEKNILILKKNIKILKVIDSISKNPELNKVTRIKINLDIIDFIICLGGGSVIDFAKATIAFNYNRISKKEFKELLCSNNTFSLENTPKIIAVPTTSGTGSELNSWGTIWDNKKKYSISGKKLIPKYAILDFNLCLSMPKSLTISSGLDAFSHSLEAIWNVNHNPLIDEIAKSAIRKIIKFLPLVIKELTNIEYRKEMQLAAVLAGLAMSKTKTAICHSISYPLTSIFNLPHGIACSLTLPEVSRLNVHKNEKRAAIISDAMGCKNEKLHVSIITFMKSLNYEVYLKPLKNATINDNIDFINPVRAKNSLVQVTNLEAANMVKKSIKFFIK